VEDARADGGQYEHRCTASYWMSLGRHMREPCDAECEDVMFGIIKITGKLQEVSYHATRSKLAERNEAREDNMTRSHEAEEKSR